MNDFIVVIIIVKINNVLNIFLVCHDKFTMEHIIKAIKNLNSMVFKILMYITSNAIS